MQESETQDRKGKSMKKTKKWQITIMTYIDGCSREAFISGFFDTNARGEELKNQIINSVIPDLLNKYDIIKDKDAIITNLVCLG